MFDFLKSVRFWKLFVIAVLEFLASQGVISFEIAHAFAVLFGGSVAVRTIDRFSEQVTLKK